MAIIVDKEKKRSDIASSCKALLLEYGIGDLTISKIAKTAGVGKGTIYEYFENKEDIVFEIITMFVSEYEERLHTITQKDITTKEKFFYFFTMIYEDEYTLKQLDIYREFLAISMINGTREMIAFNIICREKFSDILEQIITEGIKKGDLVSEAKNMVSALLTFQLGIIVESHTVALNAQKEIITYLETLFTLIQKGKKCTIN